jgi:molybdopterin synthase sulfur carrier subunit
MTITIKLFAIYKEVVGVPELVWELPSPISVAEVGDRLIQQYPQLQQWKSLTRFGINCNFVPPETILRDGDELVFIPPVSGG